MKTFLQYLHERFFDFGRYNTEIYLNPTRAELSDINPSRGGDRGELGAWVLGKNVYVWNRDKMEHDGARAVLGSKITSSSLGIYMWYRGEGRLTLRVSTFSTGARAYQGDDADTVLCATLRNHPYFKAFTLSPRRPDYS